MVYRPGSTTLPCLSLANLSSRVHKTVIRNWFFYCTCRDTKIVASAVVVWEWLNEHGRWRPYSPAVSRHIEEVIRSDPRGGSVVLGQADSRLSPYIIDLHSLHQFRQDTGKMNSSSASFYMWQAIFTIVLYNDLVGISFIRI